MSSRPLLYLIDGSSQMYRAYHAPIRTTEGTLLRNSAGIPTNAVYIFVTMLRKLLKEQAPAFIAASFDLPGRTFRDELAADYKANRAPMPDDLASQIPLVHRACEALGVPIITQERYEADDVIGTMAVRGVDAGYDIVIVTGDKDFFQLVGDHIKVYNPRDDGTWYDAAGVKEKFGVRPDQVVDVLALMGDSIDNVKGVPGIGEKGARDLITTWETLDALLDHAAEIPGKKYREALLNHRADALTSRELLIIHTNVPVPFDIETFKYRGPSRDDCYQLFTDLGFRSLTMEYAPTAETVTKDYALVTDMGALDALVEQIRAARRVAIRVLPDRPSAMRAGIVGIAVSIEARSARYIPMRHAGMHTGPQLTVADALPVLAPILEDESIEKIGHDMKFDAIVLARHGVTLRGIGLDTMIASYLLDATRSGHPLEGTALEHLGYKAFTEEDLCGRGAKATPLVDLPPDGTLDFAGERADLSLQLADALAPKLKEGGLDSVYERLERPLIPVLIDVERAGVRIDSTALGILSQRLERENRADRRAHLRPRGRTVQHRIAATAVAHPVRQAAAARTAPQREDADGEHGRRRPRGARAGARAATLDPAVARADEAEGHVHRRASTARESRNRPPAHVLQPGRRSDGPVEQQRSEPAEHPDSHRDRPRNPARHHRRARTRPHLRRLLADRVPRARASG
ncbi:MAG: 5'-3' exonuclease H3TH domain-containing protein [Vicinamibacterales bacterium]